MTGTAPILAARGVDKRFAGVYALKGVSLEVREGEVLALVGENGAGKSTLMKILAGVETPDAGELQVRGERVEFRGVGDALARGIALIHQELQLADNLDVSENIFLGREPRRGPFRDKSKMERNSVELLRRVGLDLSPRTRVADLAIGHQQMVEIAKALACDARVLIMDEPTSSLTLHETEQLFRVVKDLRARGVAVIYISHRLGEVKELADRVVVLRDGENAGELAREEISHDSLVRRMVGRNVSRLHERQPRAVGDVVLEAKRMCTRAYPEHPVSFSVRAGEIVGIAGLVGAGRSELLNAIFGVEPPVGGEVFVCGLAFDPQGGARAARTRGLALVPEDRKLQGLVLEEGVGQNLALPSLDVLSRSGFRRVGSEIELAAAQVTRVGIKTSGLTQLCGQLSGGNQQKIVVGKWLALSPKVLLLDEPTRGVDVGAKAEIYALLDRLTDEGVGVLFASSDLEEVLGLADRVLVMHEGRLAGELTRVNASEESIMSLATGGASRPESSPQEGRERRT